MGSAFASEGDDCRAHVRVESATATYKTPLFQGKAVRKDVVIDVELTSTATVPISEVELGVFLGASLSAIEGTRPSALPTARLRELPDGGVAFRALATTLLTPHATRTVRVERTALPLDRDFSTVTAVLAGCKVLEAVGGETTMKSEPPPSPDTAAGPEVAALVLAVAMVLVLVVRWLR